MASSKLPVARAAGRVIRRPLHQPGRIELVVCRGDGIHTEPAGRRDRDRFRIARRAAWGDALDA